MHNNNVIRHIESIGSDGMSRTTLEIDDKLLADVKKATGVRTTKGVVEKALKQLLRRYKLIDAASQLGSGLSELTHEELELIRRDE